MPLLYSYYRSSCSFRVRIALNLKGIPCEYEYINLHPSVSVQKTDKYREINPQCKVPFFVDGGVSLSQSMAILEYLDEAYPSVPLLPQDALEKARARQICHLIACDVQPLNNIAVLQRLKTQFGCDKSDQDVWYHHWIEEGFSSAEQLVREYSDCAFSCADEPNLVDILLVPQIWNARRFDVDLSAYPRLCEIYDTCLSHQAFIDALPENQKDFVDQ